MTYSSSYTKICCRELTPTLFERLSHKNNAFGFLRLLFAAFVIIDHAFPLGGFGEDPMWRWSLRQDSIGGICVSGFFIISGYLVTKSSLSTDIVQFAWRRCLRIFPAYWMVLLVTSLIVGPVLWYYEFNDLSAYFSWKSPGPFTYFTSNALLHIGQYSLYDLLRDTTPYGKSINASAFNGSLWTLIYERQCYILIGLLSAFGIFRRMPQLVLALTGLLYSLLVLQTFDATIPGRIAPWLNNLHIVRLVTLFMMGSCAAVFSRKMIVDDRLGMLSLLTLLLTLFKGGYFVLGYPAMVYLTLWLACRLPVFFQRIGAENDYSYGIYIYGFLVQQLLAYCNIQRMGLTVYIMLALIISVVCAWLSWHCIEKHALTFKLWGPGRGILYWCNRCKNFCLSK